MHQTSYFNQRNGSLAAGNALVSRRPSYAAEFQNRQRGYSITGGGSTLSPTTSGPTTPSGDTPLWGSGLGGSSVWGSTSIWGDSNRKSPPKSLTLQGGSVGPSAHPLHHLSPLLCRDKCSGPRPLHTTSPHPNMTPRLVRKLASISFHMVMSHGKQHPPTKPG